MVLPAILVIREYIFSTEWASSSPFWLWDHAVMPIELFHQEHRLASRMEFVLTHLRTFLEQMVLDMLNLNDLITFPTGGQHGALLPVVNV